MIKVTRLNREDTFWVNENLIEIMEETPDTMLSMMSGRKFSVAESAEEIIRLITASHRMINVSKSEFKAAAE